MKNQKRELKFFTIAEYEQEQEYLRRRHNEGWRLLKVTLPGIYLFEACEAEDVIYQLDYHKEGLGSQDTYVKMFKDCGWEYMFDFFGYSYFRKREERMQGDEEIFCDEASRLDFIGRVFKGRMIPLLVIFFLVIIPQTILQLSFLDSDPHRGMLGLYLVLFAVYAYIFIRFGLQYRKLKRQAD
ncbi:Protein of unknown function [Sphaerochaeta associata]|uniref:DUF2812 domain-containing protein n=1 Tax=Sphaerochaeta associata TaxID=1129264 RepID=A0ABY4D9X1_9SPIR|nr:DUF2812 domain-containing protein [Sphaerochaeta associata]UOM51077.1 DUF2812 domain-containing protein [Sphaerochaeta associata]SMP56580.1 Protein of unknown function [Sphaerochaeta associata]